MCLFFSIDEKWASPILGIHVIGVTEFFPLAFLTFPKWQERPSLTALYIVLIQAFEKSAFIFLAISLAFVCGERTEWDGESSDRLSKEPTTTQQGTDFKCFCRVGSWTCLSSSQWTKKVWNSERCPFCFPKWLSSPALSRSDTLRATNSTEHFLAVTLTKSKKKLIKAHFTCIFRINVNYIFHCTWGIWKFPGPGIFGPGSLTQCSPHTHRGRG